MRSMVRSRSLALAFAVVSLLPMSAAAHPGSGIVVDRRGQVYFLDTGAGLWKIDTHGALTRVSEHKFHWMSIDSGKRFAGVRLPSGPDWEITRASDESTLLLASDFPIAVGNGSLYYPIVEPKSGLQILRLMPSGEKAVLAIVPATARGPLRHVNGLAAGPDGSVYYTENDAIRRIDAQGRVSTVMADISPAGCVSIPGNDPLYLRGLDVDARGVVYVAASGCGSVLKVTPDRLVTTVFQVQTPWSPTAVALSGVDVYALEYLHTATESRREWLPRVRRISPDGKTAVVATIAPR
jgi:DNA-binding beta-propeller fold protein YncE